MKRLIGNYVEGSGKPDEPFIVRRHDNGQIYEISAARIAMFNGPRPKYPAVLICQTALCRAYRLPIEGTIEENVDGVFRAGCGGCFQLNMEIWVPISVEPLPLDPI